MVMIFFSFCTANRGVKSEPAREKIKSPVLGKTAAAGKEKDDIYQTGIASWYGRDFHGKRTANGETYDMYKLTAAHNRLPFNTIVEVKNLENYKKVIVRINDRGPFIKGRIIDLSYKAAMRIGFDKDGTAPVSLRIINSRDIKIDKYDQAPGSITQYEVEEDASCYLQAGAFSNMDNARGMQQQLEIVLPAVTFKIYFQDGLFKVISEQVYTRSKAEGYKLQLQKYGIEVFIKKK